MVLIATIQDGQTHVTEGETASDDANGGELTAAELLQRQTMIGQQFGQLELKLFELYQMERDTRPRRAELLRQLYETSQQKATTQRLDSIVKLINDGQLRLAQQAQQQTLDDFQALMLLLQNEDQSQKLRDEKKRQQENLRQIKRLLQMQQNVRNSALDGDDLQSLSLPQDRLAQQTESLSDKLQREQSGDDPNAQTDVPITPRADTPKEDVPKEDVPKEDMPNEGQPSQGQPPGDDANSKQGQPSESKPGDSSDGPAEEGDPQQASPSDQENQAKSVEDRVQTAQQKMQQAKQDLDKAKKEGALDQMKQAIQQLEQAKEELERILRQSREEEVTSTLARLEDQFRQMLEAQVRINQQTVQLDQVPVAARGADQQIATAKLGGQQRKVAISALRSAMILREDATSVALALTVDQLHQDMGEVADRLLEGKVAALTQDSQADIIETLEMLIAAVVQAQEDAQQRQQDDSQESSEAGEAGETPLVDQIAELKMVRSLQQQILKRHERLANQLATGDDLFGHVEDSAAQQILQKLVSRQGELYRMTREMLKRTK